MELALNGHTNICGTNASGKTTLQRLVPVFMANTQAAWCLRPATVSERWYLPHDSSYIIYEYQKADGFTVSSRAGLGGDGKGVNYRFIAKGFELKRLY